MHLTFSTSQTCHFVAIGKEKLPAISFLFASRGKLNKTLVHHSLLAIAWPEKV
jgi:hypothetical protein